MRDINRRIEDLERQIREPQDEPPIISSEAATLLNDIAARKRAGNITPEDEEFLAAAKAEIKKREARGEISRWGGGR